MKGDVYRREIKERKREQGGGERYVLLEEQVLFNTFWKEERVTSALSKLERSFHHWRTRYENPLDCLERPSCAERSKRWAAWALKDCSRQRQQDQLVAQLK